MVAYCDAAENWQMLLAEVFTSRLSKGPGWLRAFQRPGITTSICLGSWTPPLSPLHHPPPLLAALVGRKVPKRGRCLKCPCGSRSRPGTSSWFTAFCSWQHWGFLGFVFPPRPPITNDLPIQSRRKNCKTLSKAQGTFILEGEDFICLLPPLWRLFLQCCHGRLLCPLAQKSNTNWILQKIFKSHLTINSTFSLSQKQNKK